MIIGISGYIGSGKDTIGKIIQLITMSSGNMKWYDKVLSIDTPQEFIDDKSIWEIKKFAAKLKQIASLLTGISVEKFEDQEFKKTYLGDEWTEYLIKVGENGIPYDKTKKMTVREFLQRLGTEGIRIGVHTNAWVNALFADYKQDWNSTREANGQYPDWIITDVRFPNEAQAIKDKGGVVIRVNRPGTYGGEGAKAHPSETSLDSWEFDYSINNNGTIDELIGKVKAVIEEVIGTQINIKN